MAATTLIQYDTHTPIPPSCYRLNGTNGPPPDYLCNEQINAAFEDLRECDEISPSLDPLQTAMLAAIIDNVSQPDQDDEEPIDKYLPEPQSFKAVLHLDQDLRNAWLFHSVFEELKNLIDTGSTFILGESQDLMNLSCAHQTSIKSKANSSGDT